jgi:ribonucleoside-diphosphate reductase alpha chain
MVNGLDELLDILGDRHPLEAQRTHVELWREIGLGVMGLADLALGFKTAYGSDNFIENIDSIFNFMINKAAQASALRAKEFGTFPKYDFEKISNSRFYKEVFNKETKELIEKYGLRNSRLLSIAPTGSISNVCGISGGVEPFFMLSYQRVIKSMFDEDKKIWVYEKTPKKLMDHLGLVGSTDQLPSWAKITSQNIDYERRAKVQATLQKYVDTAISSTFNLPNDATLEDVRNILISAWKYNLKGITMFRDNCAKIGILSGGGDNFDENPAKPPVILVEESWYDKASDTSKEFVTNIDIGGLVSHSEDKTDKKYETKINKEECPLCGAYLVKRGGCTQCSNNECYYEKCAV